MRIQNKHILSFAVVLILASTASAQRRTVPGTPAETGVTITLQVAGQPYRFEGKAACHYAPVASIYNVMAEMWRVQQSDGQRSVMLTLWRPKNMSGDMFSLSLSTGPKSYLVSTVKGGESAAQGSGKVTFTTSGGGGAFRINGTTTNNVPITGTIQCSAFTQAVAEGG